jgi:putative ABC transport system substrate-binding protein
MAKINFNIIFRKWMIYILFVFTALTAWTSAVCSDGMRRIFLIETMPVPVVLDHSKWFLGQMQVLGYCEGENIEIVVIKAQGDRQLLDTLLKTQIAQGMPDLVVTNATMATQAAQKLLKTTDIPIVFMTVSDPVGVGIIEESGTGSGSNITGRIHMIDRETRINMVMRLVAPTAGRKPIRIGFIHSSYPSAVGDFRELSSAAKRRNDIIFKSHKVDYRKVPEGLPAMLEDTLNGIRELDDEVDFWWEPSGPLGEVLEYTQAILDHSNHPIVMGTKLKSVEMGALLHLTPSIEGSGREAAMLADAILKGADPGELPVVPPKDFELGINLTTAIHMNIVIPPDLLKLAGDQIYR